VGQLKHDGNATQGGFVAPGATAITFGELYRLNQWNHIALRNIGASDTVRSYDGEISPARVWYVKLPAGLSPAVGDVIYWTTGAGFKAGATDLQAAAQGSACAKVEEAKDANGYAAVRVLNIGV
jgi:hypothetical protein